MTKKPYKKILLVLLLAGLCLTLFGCADVTYRYTRVGDGTYKQTLTIVLNPDEVAAAGQDIDTVFAVVSSALTSEGFTVKDDFEHYTIVAEKLFADEAELNEDIVGSGIASVADKDASYKSLFYTVDKKYFSFTPSNSLALVAKLNIYALLYDGGFISLDDYDVTYEYATVYRSVQAYNGDTYSDGEYTVSAFDVEGEDYIILTSYQPRMAVWYALAFIIGLLLVAAILIVIRIKKRRCDNNGTETVLL